MSRRDHPGDGPQRLIARLAGVAGCLALTGCTFGVLKTDRCLEYYGEGMMIAVAEAAAKGPLAEESYGFCLDGRGRAYAMLPALRTRGFETDGPHKHFEVPGGWCLSAKRVAGRDRFDPMHSLETMCALGHASRAYMTGGSLSTSAGTTHYIISKADRKAREELDQRLANGA